jgi:hypothetical protein
VKERLVPLRDRVEFTPALLSAEKDYMTFTQNVGTTSPTQTVTIFNFGGSLLNGLNISANGGFAETNNCPSLDVGRIVPRT